MIFDLQQSIEILTRKPAVRNTLLGGLATEWTTSNEGENTWSPYDVSEHLIQAEHTNWIPRLKIILQAGEAGLFRPLIAKQCSWKVRESR